jgi:hypothetical protein
LPLGGNGCVSFLLLRRDGIGCSFALSGNSRGCSFLLRGDGLFDRLAAIRFNGGSEFFEQPRVAFFHDLAPQWRAGIVHSIPMLRHALAGVERTIDHV